MGKLRCKVQKFSTLTPWGHAPIIKNGDEEERECWRGRENEKCRYFVVLEQITQ